MKLKNLTYIIIAASTVFAGCGKSLDEKAGSQAAGKGEASLTVSIETKRTTPFNGELADGSAFNDAYVFVVKDDDNVIDGIAVVSANEDTEKEVTIENLDFGAHRIYVYANTRGFANIYPDFESTIKDLQKGDTFSYAEATFQNLTDGALPEIANDQMPLTGLVKDVNLGAGSNSVDIELIRPFVKLSIHVYNEAKYRLDVSDLSFNAISPNTAYVFDHLPYASVYTPTLEYQVPVVGGTAQVDSGKEGKIYEGLFYEGRLFADRSGDTYRASMKLKFWDAAGLGRYMTFKEFSETEITSPANVIGERRSIKVGDKYLICVNGNLMLSEHGPDRFGYPDSFQWNIVNYGNNQNYIVSVASGKYLWITPTRIGVDNLDAIIASETNGRNRALFRFNTATGSRVGPFYIKRTNAGAYVHIKSGNPAAATTEATSTLWTISSVTSTTTDECNVTDVIMRQIEEDGSSTNIRKTFRNYHYKITLFVNYTDDPVSEFIYYVNPWEKSTNEIVFN